MAFMKNVQASAKSLAENNVIHIAGTGAPTSGTSGTGVGICGPGSFYFDVTNAAQYMNTGTEASPTWTLAPSGAAASVTPAMLDPTTMVRASGTILSADITGTGAGQFGHANGVTIIPAPVAGSCIELVSVVWFFDFAVAAYTAGGNTTVNNTAGAAITGLVSAANSFGAAGDKLGFLIPLAAAYTPLVLATAVSLVTSAAFTQPGTAAGVIRWVANYRVHASGL